VQVVGGEDARDVNDPTAALAALHEIGRLKWPELSEAQAFTRAFESGLIWLRRPTAGRARCDSTIWQSVSAGHSNPVVISQGRLYS
jgi:hypothetical protein